MELKTFRLSALGRDVRVGDYYNYFTGDIRHKGKSKQYISLVCYSMLLTI